MVFGNHADPCAHVKAFNIVATSNGTYSVVWVVACTFNYLLNT